MIPSQIKRLLLFGITLIVSLILPLHHLQAQSVPFYWEFINVDIAVQTNGDMLVTETQKYTFTGDYKNQRYRYILLEKIDKITDVSVSENNQILPIETNIENNQFWIRWRHELKAPSSHTFVLKYRVIGGLHINGNDAKVYWKAIFPKRQAAVKQAQFKVEFPEQFATKIKDFQSFGTSANIRKVNPRTIQAIAQTPIEPGEELGVQVTFDNVDLQIKPPQWQSSESSFNWFPWIIGFFLFFVLPRFLGSNSNTTSITISGGDGGDGGGCGGCGGCGGGD